MCVCVCVCVCVCLCVLSMAVANPMLPASGGAGMLAHGGLVSVSTSRQYLTHGGVRVWLVCTLGAEYVDTRSIAYHKYNGDVILKGVCVGKKVTVKKLRRVRVEAEEGEGGRRGCEEAEGGEGGEEADEGEGGDGEGEEEECEEAEEDEMRQADVR